MSRITFLFACGRYSIMTRENGQYFEIKRVKTMININVMRNVNARDDFVIVKFKKINDIRYPLKSHSEIHAIGATRVAKTCTKKWSVLLPELSGVHENALDYS